MLITITVVKHSSYICNCFIDSCIDSFIDSFISQNYSGVKHGDSCSNQLTSITHGILNLLDEDFIVRGVFLDISKAFDKVWHKRSIYKLQPKGSLDNLMFIVTDLLNKRKQRVVLKGNISVFLDVKSVTPQGLITGPLLFLIYIDDIRRI